MKKLISVLAALALLACFIPALSLAGEAAYTLADINALQTGDRVALYFVAGGAFVGDSASGNRLAMVKAADPAAFSGDGAAVFTVTRTADALLFQAPGGYLTSGATGNSLALVKEASALSGWTPESCGQEGAFYLRNNAADYSGSAQYLEQYSGAITTYGLRSGGSAYIFAVYKVGDAGAAPSKAQQEARTYPVNIAVMATGDMHGALYHTKYTSGESGTDTSGLTRLATLMDSVRAQYANTLLIDAGDTIQGTPLTYYYCFSDTSVPDPAVAALRALDYDAWVPGNHEFNYGLDILNRQIAQAQAADDDKGGRVAVLSANLLKAGTTFDPWTGEAYMIKAFPYAGGEVRVGVIGLTTPNIPNWEKPANYAGIDFESFVAAWNFYAQEMKDAGCDIIIAACHAGEEAIEGDLIDNEYYEWANQVTALVTLTSGIDLVIGAHTHTQEVVTLQNKDGEDVTILHTGSGAQALGVAKIGFDPATGEISVKAENRLSDGTIAPDKALTALLRPYEDACWNKYMNAALGRATAAFEAPGNMLAPNAFLDLVNAAQLDAGYDKAGYTASTEDDIPPMMSITAPLNSGEGVVLGAGDITMGQMFRLYRFENWLYTVEMTAAEIDAWLEYVAERQYGTDANGQLFGGGTYCDCLYGEGVSYTIDLSREIGDRVLGLSYQGKALDQKDDDTFYTVVLNNYRYTGGGSYCKSVYQQMRARKIDSDLVVYDPDTKTYAINDARQVFSTQYGMDGGEDRGQARNLIAQFIRAQGAISPIVTSQWRVTQGK